MTHRSRPLTVDHRETSSSPARPQLRAVPAEVAGTGRRTLSNRAAYALAAGVIGLGLFASVTPSPLYHTYSVLWGFSSLTLTLIFATYAFGVLATLLLAGRVSDVVGRRPVLLIALALLMGSTVLFMFAGSAVWLFFARGLQGLATGAALSAASAALLDLHPRRDPAGVALLNGVASTTGIGLGILVSSSLVSSGRLSTFCRTSSCSFYSRSRSPVPTGCRSLFSSAGASG